MAVIIRKKNLWEMKSYFLTFVLLFLVTSLIQAQTTPIKWELVYDSIPTMGRQVELTNDNCYIVTASNDLTNGITLKIDAHGKIIWVKPYGGSCIRQTIDHGYIISNDDYAGLFKLNQYGDSLWFKSYGGYIQDDFSSVIQASDYGFVACGNSQSYGDSFVFVVKTDSSGKLLWKRSLCSSYFSSATDLVEIDKYYYVVGYVEDSLENYKIVIDKLSANGILIWQKILDVGFFAFKIIQTEDKNIIITGDHTIMKLTLNGDSMWKKELSDGLDDVWYLSSIKQTYDKGYILAGYSCYDENHGYWHNLIAKTDSAGKLIWNKVYPTSEDNFINIFGSVQPTPDHGFIACGCSTYNDITKLRIIKADSIGNCITGINITFPNKGCNIYPNPTTGKIIIDAKDIKKVEILDINGAAVFSRENTVKEVDISNEPNGIYFLILTTANGISIEKIIKE